MGTYLTLFFFLFFLQPTKFFSLFFIYCWSLNVNFWIYHFIFFYLILFLIFLLLN